MKNNMMKKVVAILVSLVLVISTSAITMSAIANDSIAFDYNDETGVLTVTGSGAIDDYDENSLETIPWYTLRNIITSVVVSEGITEIGNYAFCREVNVTDVQLPSTLTRIGDAAFAGNTNLKSLTIPDSVTTVGDYAFGYTYDMSLTEGFVTYCGNNSAAQRYCIKSYVPFDAPFDVSGNSTAVILGSNWQAMWSFVPKADGVLTFWSTGGADTYGLIYDASTYTYNDKFFQMSQSAVATGDDISSSNCNFEIVYNVTAGTRYYLAAKYMSASKTSGSFATHMTFVCTEHNYDVTDTATCTADGTKTSVCVACGHTMTETSLAKGHTPGEIVIENDNASTCIVAGSYDEVTYCTVCNAETSRETKEHALAEHNYLLVASVAPTCTDGGYDTYECSVCTDTYNDNFTDPVEHVPDEPKETVVKPTCTDPGATLIEIYCGECGELLEQDMTDIKEPLGHDYAEVTVDPTCTAKGKTTYTCSRCEDTYEEEISMLEHTLGEATRENEVAPTCTKAGSYDMVTRCTECENIVDTQTTKIDALGHSYTEIIGFADGEVSTVCDRCDKYKTYTFMDYFGTDFALLDVVEDGIVNAKDYAKLRREYTAPDVVCDIDLTAGTVSRDNAVLADGVLTLTPAGRYAVYNITGDAQGVTIVVNAACDTDIKLSNANITVDSANAITINNIATDGTIPTVTISATEGSSNSITTTTSGNAITNYSDNGACKLEFKGHGTLTLNTAKTAVNSGGKVEIKNITLDITSANRGIDTSFTTAGVTDYASIDVEGNATITINSNDDGIRCKNFETKALAAGEVDSVINITAGGDGIQMEGKKSAFNSGVVTINANGYAFNCAAANFKINAGSTIDATGKKGYSK